MVLLNSVFHTRSNFADSFLQFGYVPLRAFSSPVLGRESLKHIVLRGRHIIGLTGALTYLGTAVVARHVVECRARRLAVASKTAMDHGNPDLIAARYFFFALSDVNCRCLCFRGVVDLRPLNNNNSNNNKIVDY
jgi:hypothetical protein